MSIIVYDEFILLVIYLWKSSGLVTVLWESLRSFIHTHRSECRLWGMDWTLSPTFIYILGKLLKLSVP